MANNYPSLEELIAAAKTGGPGDVIQSGLEGYTAGRKRRLEEDKTKAEAAIAQAKQRLEQEKQQAELITPVEQQTHTTTAPATPAKIKALTPKGPGKKGPDTIKGPNGEVLQVHRDEDGNITGTTPLTGPREKQVNDQTVIQSGDFNTLATQIDKVRKSVKPEYVGPVQGRTGELAQTVDLPSIGLGANKERSDFLSNVNSIRNQLIYLRSGKQINESEYERLIKELPDETRSYVDFQAKLDNFQNVFNEIAQNRRKAFEEGGYRDIPNYTPPQGTPGTFGPTKRAFTVKSITKVPGK